MKKYKVVYDRKDCIGAASCTAVNQKWIMNDDGKADLIDSEKIQDNEVQEKIIDENELAQMMESAQVCPVQVIHIYDLESGEKLL